MKTEKNDPIFSSICPLPRNHRQQGLPMLLRHHPEVPDLLFQAFFHRDLSPERRRMEGMEIL